MSWVDTVTFFSMKQLEDYVTVLADTSHYLPDGTENPHWLDLYKTVVRDTKFNYHYENGEFVMDPSYYDVIRSDIASSVGDSVSVASSTSSAAAGSTSTPVYNNVGGGGVKTMPQVNTVVTDKSTGTANVADSAKGYKPFGIDSMGSIMNILAGVANAFGLANMAINAQNSHIWRDLVNNVFDGDLTPEATIDEIKSILHLKLHKIVAVNEAGKPCYMVPATIAERLYDFFAVHMVETGGSETMSVYLPALIFSLCVYGERDPDHAFGPWYYARYYTLLNTTAPNTGHVYFDITNISDDLFKQIMTDFIATKIGSGFLVSEENVYGLVNSLNGLTETLEQGTVGDFDYNRLQLSLRLNRGSTPPSKDTPVSPSEISIDFYLYNDQNLTIDTSDPDHNRVNCYSNTGMESKYLKRGREGDNDSDYAYSFIVPGKGLANSGHYAHYTITYPANTFTLTKLTETTGTLPTAIDRSRVDINGMDFTDNYELIPTQGGGNIFYSNFGYRGEGANYEPDEYLSLGWQRRNTEDKTPNPNKTMAENYSGWLDHMHILSQPDRDGNHIQTNYLPVNVPVGDDATDRLINHGSNSNTDPDAYRFSGSQSINQRGDIPTDTPIDDVNKEIHDAIDEYNESRTDPDSAPEPIPEPMPGYPDPNPQYPTQPDVDPPGESDEPPTPGDMPGVEASGMVSVYNPTKDQIISFSQWLWSPNFIDNLLKLFQNPMDGIIGLHILYATPSTTTPDNIRVGYLDSGVSSKVVDKQFIEVDCGYIDIPEFYGNAIDYEPYTQVHMYLPFVGIVSLKPNDVIGKKLYCKYGVDVLTGTCLAMLTTKKGKATIGGYTFSGNCAVQVPISGGSYAQVISGLASMAIGVGAGIATGNPIMAVGGAMAGVMSSHLDVAHSGSIGANAGAMGPRTPYIIITRKITYDANNYNQFYGYPANNTVVLGTCKGYTRIKSVHIDTIDIATDNEKTEIENLLKEGVIIK